MNARPAVLYGVEPSLDALEFQRILVEAGLARPTDDIARLDDMLKHADLVVTARLDRDGRPLVGVARSITDFTWCCYLSDLAVAKDTQGLGIGKGLLEETRRRIGPRVSLILASLPDAVGFYERIGMPRMPGAYWYKRQS